MSPDPVTVFCVAAALVLIVVLLIDEMFEFDFGDDDPAY